MAVKNGKVGFGMVGLNWGIGRCAMIRQVPEAELVAVAARTEKSAREGGEKLGVDWYTDYREMLKRPDLDVVAIYTPSTAHAEIAIDAARAGKNLIITKPMEGTLERVDAIVNAANQAGVKLATEFMTRYIPANYTVHQAVQAGQMGKLLLGEFAYKCYRPHWYFEMGAGYRGTWAGDGGGTVMLQGIHTVDQMLWFMGDVESVTAHWAKFVQRTETEDTAVALVKFTSGALASFVSTNTYYNALPAGQYGGGSVTKVDIGGERGSAVIEGSKLTSWKTAADEPAPAVAPPPTINVFDDFVHWLRDDSYSAPTLVKAEESRRTVEFILALYESARTGKTVTIGARDS